MKSMLLLVLYSILSFTTASEFLQSVEDHYWRDYQGLVPTDALIGGTNKDGEKTYVGQMSIQIGCNSAKEMNFIPATITHRNRNAIGVFCGKAITSDLNSNVKVLCSNNLRRYLWHTEPSAVTPGCRYVVAGQANLIPMYVGRVVYQNQTLFGKIVSTSGNLYVSYEGEILKLQNYATLMYCI